MTWAREHPRFLSSPVFNCKPARIWIQHCCTSNVNCKMHAKLQIEILKQWSYFYLWYPTRVEHRVARTATVTATASSARAEHVDEWKNNIIRECSNRSVLVALTISNCEIRLCFKNVFEADNLLYSKGYCPLKNLDRKPSLHHLDFPWNSNHWHYWWSMLNTLSEMVCGWCKATAAWQDRACFGFHGRVNIELKLSKWNVLSEQLCVVQRGANFVVARSTQHIETVYPYR